MRNQPLWLWMNLLSLDAPLVALVWQDFLSRTSETTLLPAGRCVLGLTVWAIYIADRLLDVRGPASTGEPLHHRFYREHRRAWCIALAAVALADLLCTVFWLRPVVFIHGLAVAGASLAYLALFTEAGSRWVFWKKPVAAMLFSAGVFLVASVNAPGRLLWPWASFALLCGGNLILIERWKRNLSTEKAWVPMLVFVAVCAAQRSTWYGAVGVSAVALAAVARFGSKLSVEARRVLADLALLTPIVLR
jgi:hypothetical protein